MTEWKWAVTEPTITLPKITSEGTFHAETCRAAKLRATKESNFREGTWMEKPGSIQCDGKFYYGFTKSIRGRKTKTLFLYVHLK